MARGATNETNRYKAIIETIFFAHWEKGLREFEFEREEIVATAAHLSIDLPRNLGDVVYSIRYRTPLPEKVLTYPARRAGMDYRRCRRARYRFKLVPATRIKPNPALASIGIPDATPELIRAYVLDDEQALLAIVRYNRLIDTFLGLTTYSLQNHLRTTVRGIGQIEIDELYVGLDKHGCHYIIPVQAKGGRTRSASCQTTAGYTVRRTEFFRHPLSTDRRAIHARRRHRAFRVHPCKTTR